MVFESSPEPEPEFEVSRKEWGSVWPVHIYLFASLFMILTLYNVHSIIGLIYNGNNLKKKKIFMFANVMLASFNLVTSLQLFIDPYGSDEHHLKLMVNGLYFIAFGMKIPALTAAFSFIYIALTQTAKVKLYSRKLQNVKYFAAIIVIHFLVALSVHVYLAFNGSHFIMIIICLSFFLLFSIAIWLLFLCMYVRLKRLIGNNAKKLSKIQLKHSPRKDDISMSHIESGHTAATDISGIQPEESIGVINSGLVDDGYPAEMSNTSKEYGGNIEPPTHQTAIAEEKQETDVELPSNANGNLPNSDLTKNAANGDQGTGAKSDQGEQNIYSQSQLGSVDKSKVPRVYPGAKLVLPTKVAPREQSKETTLNRVSSSFADKSLQKLLKLVTVVSLSSLLYCSAIVYYIVILVLNSSLLTAPWPWFVYQTIARFAEFGMSGTMSYLVRRSIKSARR